MSSANTNATTIPEYVAHINNLREASASSNSSEQQHQQQPANGTATSSTTPGWRGDASALATLVSQARAQHSEQAAQLRITSPRILVVGPSGSGKSSLINTTFGIDTAAVRGGGTPVTNSFNEYGPYKHIPIRLIDSRGLERGNTYEQQCDEISEYIKQQNDTVNINDHVHIVWYIVGGRWEQGDIQYVTKLRQHLPVIVIINKVDLNERNVIDETTGLQAKVLLRDSIVKTFDDIDIIFCGDTSKQLEGWEPNNCGNGHSKDLFEVMNNRKRTWYCGYENCTESGIADDKLIGYNLLSELTISKLPQCVNISFIHAQKINMQMKNDQAINIIKTGVFAMTGIAMTPIPFSDMPFLLAAEGYMSISLFNLYNVPVSFADVTFFSTVNVIVVGALGGAAKVVAGLLKASTIGLPVGMVVDMVIAATSGTAIGIAIAKVAQTFFLKGLIENSTNQEEFKKFVVETIKEINLIMLLKAVFQLLIFKDHRPVTEMIQANVQVSDINANRGRIA